MIDKNILIEKLDSIVLRYNKQSIVLKALKLKDRIEKLNTEEEKEIIFTWEEDVEMWERDLKHIDSLLKLNLITKEEAKQQLILCMTEKIEQFFDD